MSSPIDTDDLAAFASAFAISLAAAFGPEQGNEGLRRLAHELRDFSERAPGTAAAEALAATAEMLGLSDPTSDGHRE